MKKLLFVIILSVFLPVILISQDTTGWINKGNYLEQKLKVGAITFIRYSKDENSLFTYGKDSTIRIWDVKTGNITKELKIRWYNSNFDISYDDSTFATYYDGCVDQRDFSGNRLADLCSYYNNYPPPSNCVDPDKRLDNSFFLFHPFTNQIIFEPCINIWCCCEFGKPPFSPIEGWFECCSYDKPYARTIFQHGSAKRSLTFSPNGSYTAYFTFKQFGYNEYETTTTVIADPSFNILAYIDSNFNNGNPKGFDYYTNFKYMVFSHDSRFLAYQSTYSLKILKVNGSLIKEFIFADLGINRPDANIFSKDCKKLFTGSKLKNGGSSIRLWDISTGKLRNFCDFNDSIIDWKFAMSKDSTNLTTGSSDGYIRIFDNSISEAVTASFSADTNVIPMYTSLKFNNLSLGYPSKWKWNFGDGKSSSLENPEHIFTSPGKYSVSLIVTKGTISDTLILDNYITVIDPSYVFKASFSVDSSIIPVKKLITFHDLSIGNPKTWLWNFGDKVTGTIQNPEHYYINTGTYTVSLIVYNGSIYDTLIRKDYITVTEPSGIEFPNLNTDNIIIYPNPVSDYLEIIENNQTISPNEEIQIYNSKSELVLNTCKIELSLPMKIDVSSLASGMYFLKIGDKIIKFVKKL